MISQLSASAVMRSPTMADPLSETGSQNKALLPQDHLEEEGIFYYSNQHTSEEPVFLASDFL